MVWVVKYRYKMLSGEIAGRARDLVRYTCKAFEIWIIEDVESKDHAHILINTSPNMVHSEIIRQIKGMTSSYLSRVFRI
jgi:putative transposase